MGTAISEYKAKKEAREKKINEASNEVIELLKTQSLTFDDIEDILSRVKENIRSTIIVD